LQAFVVLAYFYGTVGRNKYGLPCSARVLSRNKRFLWHLSSSGARGASLVFIRSFCQL
jgi:hypothetical protein